MARLNEDDPAQPFFDRSGLLTVGYAYPNLVISENYNATGSPYSALKTFLLLALAEDSAFWTVEEVDMLQRPEVTEETRFETSIGMFFHS
ncbi:DUF2264 domain-containing protein [Paenibacillus sp. CN-4]|uniref:DUF2264 domain-containing protein n=1 Tax=Paenibacillus nanchangensis TaxID=3348343 RepID=UPI00397BAAD6